MQLVGKAHKSTGLAVLEGNKKNRSGVASRPGFSIFEKEV